MAFKSVPVAVADGTTETLASGIAGVAGNDRNGEPSEPIPCVIQNLGPGDLYISADVADVAGTGVLLEPGAAFDDLELLHGIGLEEDHADILYGEASGGACDVRVIYQRQGTP